MNRLLFPATALLGGIALWSVRNQVPPVTASQLKQETASVADISALKLGTNQDFGGYIPFQKSDILQQDVSGAPVSIMNAQFQTRYGKRGLGMDASIVNNVVDSSSQSGAWYRINTNDGDNTMVFLTGAEHFEGQTVALTPFTCWATKGVQDGGDHHLIVYDKATKTLIEMYQPEMCDGRINAYSAKLWDLSKSADKQNYFGGDSVDAAGMVLSFGTLRYEDAVNNTIRYAVRFTVDKTSALFYKGGVGAFCGMVEPAKHGSRDKCTGDPGVTPVTLPYGARIRLKASFDVSGYPPEIRNILNAQKTYGMYFADTGGYYFQATLDNRWDTDHTSMLGHIPLSSYELVTVGTDGLRAMDTIDDASGSDSILYSYSQTATGGMPPYTYNHAVVKNPYNRPKIQSFTASATSIPLGSSITFTLIDTNCQVHYIDNAGAFSGNTVTVHPLRTTTYTAYSRGSYGIAKGKSITVKVTGTTGALIPPA